MFIDPFFRVEFFIFSKIKIGRIYFYNVKNRMSFQLRDRILPKRVISIAVTVTVILIAGITLIATEPWKNGARSVSVCSYVEKSRLENIEFLVTAEKTCPKENLDAVLKHLLKNELTPNYIQENQDVLKQSLQAKTYFETLLNGKKLKINYNVVQVNQIEDWSEVRIVINDCERISTDELAIQKKVEYLHQDECGIEYISRLLPNIEETMKTNDVVFLLEAHEELRKIFNQRLNRYNLESQKKLFLMQNSVKKSVMEITTWSNVAFLFLESNCEFFDKNIQELVSSFRTCENQRTQILEILYPTITIDLVPKYLEGKEGISEDQQVISHVLEKISSFKSDGRIVVLEGNRIVQDIKNLKQKRLHFELNKCTEALNRISSHFLVSIQTVEILKCADLNDVVAHELNLRFLEIKDYQNYLNGLIPLLESQLACSKLDEVIKQFNKKQQQKVLMLVGDQAYASATLITDWTNVKLMDISLDFELKNWELFNFFNGNSRYVTFSMTQHQLNTETCHYILNQLERNPRILHSGFIFTNECRVTADFHVLVQYNVDSITILNQLLSKAKNLISTQAQKEQLKNDFRDLKSKKPESFYWVEGSEETIFDAIDSFESGMEFKHKTVTQWYYSSNVFPEKVAYEFMKQFKDGDISIAHELTKRIPSWHFSLQNLVRNLFKSIKKTPTKKNFLKDLPMEFNSKLYTFECSGIDLSKFSCTYENVPQ